ncbi:unnamed protein product [Echinostoma caproni]|uniref:RRM domain-containing protein n=1 Tax=Echinostoma caproni TaxID=27848 RepID=A0A183AMD3_9TREM|nr:unnamed protein product [Echinostoma caproni]
MAVEFIFPTVVWWIMSQESMADNCPSNLWFPYIRKHGFYDPIIAGSIDGTDEAPHDRAIVRALSANYKPNYQAVLDVDPKATLFLGRLPYAADTNVIREALRKLLNTRRSNQLTDRSGHRSVDDRHSSSRRRSSRRSRSPFANPPKTGHNEQDDHLNPGDELWPKIRLVRNIVTGFPRGYGFAYFRSADEATHVLQCWLHQARSYTDKRNPNIGGLDMPGGEKASDLVDRRTISSADFFVNCYSLEGYISLFCQPFEVRRGSM